ncbi:MAG: hypothetical protein ACTS85_04075 [Arsenophonus sp. NC-PG7-MAG3]
MISGLILRTLVVFSVKALNLTAKISVAFFKFGIRLDFLLKNHYLINLVTTVPIGITMILNVAIIAVVVGYMTSAFTTPDISYFAKVLSMYFE